MGHEHISERITEDESLSRVIRSDILDFVACFVQCRCRDRADVACLVFLSIGPTFQGLLGLRKPPAQSFDLHQVGVLFLLHFISN